MDRLDHSPIIIEATQPNVPMPPDVPPPPDPHVPDPMPKEPMPADPYPDPKEVPPPKPID